MHYYILFQANVFTKMLFKYALFRTNVSTKMLFDYALFNKIEVNRETIIVVSYLLYKYQRI